MSTGAKGSPRTPQAHAPSTLLYLGCTAGIYVFYLAFGLIQEYLKHAEFGAQRERFRHTAFLLLAQCLANWALATVFIRYFRAGSPPGARVPASALVPMRDFAVIAVSYAGAMYCSNRAVLLVDYPTNVLAKSIKPIPVLLVAVIATRGAAFYGGRAIAVALITCGAATFFAGRAGDSAGDRTSTPVGIALLLASLLLDGLTAHSQDAMVATYCKAGARSLSQWHLMLYPNMLASLMVGVVALCTGELTSALAFCARHPQAAAAIAAFAAVSALGQVFIYLTIANFGTLTCSIVTTMRKFTSILFSVVMYGHPLSHSQWVGVAGVFGGVAMDMHLSRKAKLKNQQPKLAPERSPKPLLHGEYAEFSKKE